MIYHYTKGYCLKSIFNDGFIATESKRGLNPAPRVTDYVWLTSSFRFPKTALPLLSNIPSTSLEMHLYAGPLAMDYESISRACAGLYRFGFHETDNRFTPWFRSNERRAMRGNHKWEMMERIANKVGDDVRSFWISTNDITLSRYTLERLVNNQWVTLIDSLAEPVNPDPQIMKEIYVNANNWLRTNGYKDDAFKRAA